MWPMLCRWRFDKSTVLQHSRTQLLRSLGKRKEKTYRQVAIESDSSQEEVFGLLPKEVYYLSFLQLLPTRVPLLEEELDTMPTIHPLKKNPKWFSMVSSVTVPQLMWDSKMNISAWLCSFTVTMCLFTAASCGAPTIAIACHVNLSQGTLHTVGMITFHPVGFQIASSRLCTHSCIKHNLFTPSWELIYSGFV